MVYRTFQIILDSPSWYYHAGSTVAGKIILELDKPKKVRGLRIKFEGRAKVSWTESDDDKSETYSAREDYIYNLYYLIGSASSEIEIPAGEHSYPFSTTLPAKLPTAFEGKYGNIRYYIKAVLDRPWKFDEEVKQPLAIETAPIDLNSLPQVKEPVIAETSKTFCCLCCTSGPLTLSGSIPYSGFVPGQSFLATIEVDNASNVDILSIKCKLIKELTWISKSPSTKKKIDKNTLTKVCLDGVAPGRSKSWNQKIEIPSMSIMNLEACSVIKVEYYLLIVADPSGAHIDLELKFPITLGTVPLSQMGGTWPASFPDTALPYLPVQPSAPYPEDVGSPSPVGFISSQT